MFKKVEFKAQNDQQAEIKAVELLKLSNDKITINLISEDEDENQYEAYVDVLLALEGKKYLTGMLKSLQIDAQIEVRTLNGVELFYTISSDENPLLIGKNGKTLEALQLLTKIYLNLFTDEKIMVSIDVGNYKGHRQHQLEVLATKTAKEVAKTKIEVMLQPMNSYERRIIHTKLSDWRDVYTESIGEGINRRLVIKPKNK